MTAASSPHSSEPNPLDPIIAAYLEAVERGDKPDRDRLMLDHLQLASDLRAFFADLDRGGQHICLTVGAGGKSIRRDGECGTRRADAPPLAGTIAADNARTTALEVSHDL